MRRLGIAAATALALLATNVALAPTALADATIDTNSRDAVAKAYREQLLPTLAVKPKWTGKASKCVKGKPAEQPAAAVGTESAASKKATFQAINYYRSMAGLQPVVENAQASRAALQAALIMHANDSLSHYPPTSWKCYSALGAAAAGTSNIAIYWDSRVAELPATRAIELYMDDSGATNTEVGHRRWVLYPPASEFGTGSTSTTNALKVFFEDGEIAVRAPNPRPAGGTAWPSPGYFPAEILPESARWSYSIPLDTDPDFGAAKVAVTRNGKAVTTKIIARDGYLGDPALVWELPSQTLPKGDAVDTYKVAITGVTTPNGSLSIEYQVKVFRATPKFTKAPKPTISGTAKVGKKLTAKPGTWKPAGATLTYQWYRNGKKISGATKTKYTLKKADKGKKITVKVTGKKAGYQTVTKTSTATKKVK